MTSERTIAFTICFVVVLLGCSSSTAALDEVASSLVDIIAPDSSRLLSVLQSAQPYDDLRSSYLIMRAVQSVGFSDSNMNIRKSACTFATNHVERSTTVEDVFYATSVGEMLKNTCKISLTPALKKLVKDSLTGEPSVETLYHAITVMAYGGMKIDNTTVPQALMTALENDDTPLSYARAFHAAALIPNVNLPDLFDQIEDIVAQADETPTILYYEGGLKVTSMVITGIFALAAQTGDAPAITEVQATKFGNYISGSKYSISLEEVSYLLSAAAVLSNNKWVVPVSLRLAGRPVISQSIKNLEVRLTNIFDRSVGTHTVTINSITSPDGTMTKKDKVMTIGKDTTTYSYPISGDLSEPGVYNVVLSTKAKTMSAAVELSNVEIQVTNTFQVSVSNAQLVMKDRDQDIISRTISLMYPSTSRELLEVDEHQKLLMTFTLVDKNKNTQTVSIHQAFVRFSANSQEIFYVSSYNSKTGQYTFELDVANAASDFASLSTNYSMSLIIGGFTVENPFSWEVVVVKFKFPTASAKEEEPVDVHSPRPVINHVFRTPEKRPSPIISTTFTVLTILPLAIMFISWLVLGANISNITVGGIWAVLFHLGLGAILGLFYCFWLQLNMFQTLKYLAGIGVFTFITGNRMLRNIAKSKE